LTKLQGTEVLNLLIAVDELNIQTLIQCIQEYLINYQHDFLQQNSVEILESVYQYEAFSDLWNYCLDIICENSDLLFNSDKFITLKESLLELLLKRDDLTSDEIVIWDSLIKWCFAQHPSIQKDVGKWNKGEIITIGRILHRFIPLIRFYHIASKDFLLKVYPFKVFLPEDMIDNLLAFHMVPARKLDIYMQTPRKPKFVYDSVIIGPQHFALFSNWIEKKNNSYYNERNIPYKFDLLFRANRDGNRPADFHAKCDNKGATIVIVKVKDSEEILGGYNPLQWDSSIIGPWKYTTDSFIFSFKNSNILSTAKVGHINEDYNRAIYCCQNHGPGFGYGRDLFQDNDGIWKSYGSYSYPKIDIPKGFKMGVCNAFNVENYEVFQVTKK
jgi:hypothetical protein